MEDTKSFLQRIMAFTYSLEALVDKIPLCMDVMRMYFDSMFEEVTRAIQFLEIEVATQDDYLLNEFLRNQGIIQKLADRLQKSNV
jgi:hypothetical protein